MKQGYILLLLAILCIGYSDFWRPAKQMQHKKTLFSEPVVHVKDSVSNEILILKER